MCKSLKIGFHAASVSYADCHRHDGKWSIDKEPCFSTAVVHHNGDVMMIHINDEDWEDGRDGGESVK